MHRRPRPDRKCRPVLANPRWFGMRYRRTEAAGPRGSVTVPAAAAAAAVGAVFGLVAGRRWPPAAAARTPRRHYWWRCRTKAGWRPGGPPPWPAWPCSWLGLGRYQNDERIRMFVGDLQLKRLAGPASAPSRRRRVMSFVVTTERRFRDQNCHLTSKPRNRRTKHGSDMC